MRQNACKCTRDIVFFIPFLVQRPPPLTPKSVVTELQSIKRKWYQLGAALGLPNHELDSISTEHNIQLRLKRTVHSYFRNKPRTVHVSAKEEIVKALKYIGEAEAADRIDLEYTKGAY